jgi:ribonuclease R
VAKRRPLSDPFAEREKMRYQNPIPSRELIMEVLKKKGKPAKPEELQKQLDIKDDPERIDAFNRRLAAMERDGQLHTTRRGEYGLVSKMNLISGRIIGHRDGFGFVVPDDGSDDLFLPAKYMRSVFDGDKVLVRIANIDKRGRLEAGLVQVLECNTKQLVGKLVKEQGLLFVVPDHKRITQEILIPPGEENGAKNGQIVTVEITSQPSIYKQPIGKIIEILGDQRAPGMEIDIAVRTHSLPHDFPDIVIKEAQKYKELKPGATYTDREDIRDLPLVTIDGEDAMDFDDAVYCEKKSKNGWRLVVAIADVSYYVKPGSELDQEAYSRGNSVYFPGKVIPMLPENLSNGLCSLNPNVDRFCMVCDMEITIDGDIKKYKFYPAVMNSKARLTYTQVAAALDGDKKALELIGKLYPHIETFHELYQQLLKKRHIRGALDFDTVETKVVFSADRKIEKIVPTVRNVAHKMIEEAMLCANVSASKFLIKNKIPGLYRIHEGPNPEKLVDLRDFLKEFNLGLRGGDSPRPSDYSALLESIQDRPEVGIIQTVLLRSLQQAVYSPDNEGHFGLAYEAYTHFTSPIRRYPDLLVHRQIKNNSETEVLKLQLMGEHCSFTERRADEASRDAMTALKCEFIANRVGENFDGIITSVAGFGLFVELKDLYVEGLIHITLLPSDYYRFDPKKHRLLGERSGLNFNLGDKIKVRVVRVDVDNKKIDLELAGMKKAEPKPNTKSGKKSGKRYGKRKKS